jgi:hypothetical membrane protein
VIATGGRFRRRRLALLWLGFAAPLFAAALVLGAVLSNPQVDGATRYVSELGARDAANPGLFNGAMLLAGAAAAGLGVGFALAVTALGGAARAAWASAALFAIAGAGLILSGLFPWPDPRHLAVQAGLGAQLAPALLAYGLRRSAGVERLRRFLWAAFVVLLALAIVNSGWIFAAVLKVQPFGWLVHGANVGWWERGYMLALAGWVVVAAVWLERRLAREP